MRKRRKMIQRFPICTGVLAAAAIGVLVCTVLGEKRHIENNTVAQEAAEMDAGIVIWNGNKYRYNEHLSNYLFIGVDHNEITETSVGEANAGQADVIYVMSLDSVENRLAVITVPRDTLTQIRLFGPGGEDLGTTEDHISLSYAYGDGRHESCRLTKEAVSQLLYGLPIQSYCSLSMDAMNVLTETVDTLTVTVPNDSLENAAPSFAEGREIVLTPDNTDFFLRYRDIDISQSAIARMERQQAFLKAYAEKAKERFSQQPAFATELYQVLKPYMVTSMGKDVFVKLAGTAAAGREVTGWTVPGKGVEGSSYDEYEADDEALYSKIIETFYEETE